MNLVNKIALIADGSTVILLVMMMFVQNLRRLYECLCVSVFSGGRMNLFHYGAGMMLYATFHVAVVLEGPVLHQYTNTAGEIS